MLSITRKHAAIRMILNLKSWTKNIELMNIVLVIEAIWPLWLICVLFGGIGTLFAAGLACIPSTKTRRIIILGSTASGKTTLWNQLRNRNVGYDYVASQQAKIESFLVKYGDHSVKVLATKDFSGGDLYVKYYEDLINENGTFIYFLIDLTKLQETKQEVRSRLQFISKCIKDKKLENCGFKILATHFDLCHKTEDAAKADVLSSLTDKKITKCSLNIDLDHIMVVDLLSSFYIDKIKKEITLEG